jgi:hypothetical protein
MNWIKINKDTVIPDTVPVLIKVTLGGGILKGCIIPDTNSIFEVEHRETVYQREEYSHYCLVSEPTDTPIVPKGLSIIDNKLRGLTYKDDLTKGTITREDPFRKHTYLDECDHLVNEIEKGAQIRLHKATDYDNGVSSIKVTIFFFPKDD